jgi:hypothetical protein
MELLKSLRIMRFPLLLSVIEGALQDRRKRGSLMLSFPLE